MAQAKSLVIQRRTELDAKRRLIAVRCHAAARTRQSRGAATRPPRRRLARPRPSSTAASSRAPWAGSSTTCRSKSAVRRSVMAARDRDHRRARSDAGGGRGVGAPACRDQGRRHRQGQAGHRRDHRRQNPFRLQDGEPEHAYLSRRGRTPQSPTAPFRTASPPRSSIPLAPTPAMRVPRSALTIASTGDIGVRTVDADGKVASNR